MSTILTAKGHDGSNLSIFTLGASQNIVYAAAGGAAASNSTPFGAPTRGLLLCCVSGAFRIKTGPGAQTADSSSTLLPNGSLVAIAIHNGWTLSVISNDTTTGSLCVTELAPGPS